MTLEGFFRENSECALAFSGGADSAFLLYAARKYARRVRAYCVKSAFQPGFELDDARRLDADVRVIDVDVLSLPDVRKNSPERCYFCKRAMFSAIGEAAREEGFTLVIDGTNASDDASDRPGMRALRELGVRSPLRECGLTKDEVRRLSREAGLFTWDKPAYACLATRIAAGEEISAEKLRITEAAESELFALGFRDFRVRLLGGSARLQLREEQLPLLLERRGEVLDRLKGLYGAVLLDLEVRGEQ